MTVAQQLWLEGYLEGFQEGYLRVMQDRKCQIARNMLKENLPVELITEITGLAPEKIDALVEAPKPKPKLTFYEPLSSK